MDKRVETKNDVVDASHIVVKSGCYPFRIVLRKMETEGKYVVHKELLKTEAPGDPGISCRFVHVGFELGSYFDYNTGKMPFLPTEEEARVKAEKEFTSRVYDL